MSDVWTYRDGTLGADLSAQSLVGYGVEAEDGSIGKVDDWTYEVGSCTWWLTLALDLWQR